MKDSARAFAPANISLIFETYEAEPPHDRGSLGAGITLERGVVGKLSRAKETVIMCQGKRWEFPTVATVLRELTDEPVRVELDAAFPFGCGFGMSGASALVTAFAANKLLGLKMSRRSLCMIAHRAEVANSTGLGDVGGQCNGGIMIKTRKHAPLSAKRLPLQIETLHTRVFGPIHTPSVINSREKLASVNAAGHAALAQIRKREKDLTLDELLDISLHFAASSGLLTNAEVRKSIDQALKAGGHASMIMLGDAVVSTKPFPGSEPSRVVYSGVKLLD